MPLSERLYRQRKDIPDATFGPNEAWCTRIHFQFPPQAQNLYIDTTIENVIVDAGRLQKMLARKRSLGSLEKGQQQCILARFKNDVLAKNPSLVIWQVGTNAAWKVFKTGERYLAR